MREEWLKEAEDFIVTEYKKATYPAAFNLRPEYNVDEIAYLMAAYAQKKLAEWMDASRKG